MAEWWPMKASTQHRADAEALAPQLGLSPVDVARQAMTLGLRLLAAGIPSPVVAHGIPPSPTGYRGSPPATGSDHQSDDDDRSSAVPSGGALDQVGPETAKLEPTPEEIQEARAAMKGRAIRTNPDRYMASCVRNARSRRAKDFKDVAEGRRPKPQPPPVPTNPEVEALRQEVMAEASTITNTIHREHFLDACRFPGLGLEALGEMRERILRLPREAALRVLPGAGERRLAQEGSGRG